MKKSRYSVFVGNCIDLMRKCPAHSVDAIATDPPYGLKFMGKAFDDLGEGAQQREWHKAWAKEALRVLKPGGHIIAFGGTRTYHHLASALEEVGFEIRDCISWVHGQGFPKSLNVGKAIDKAMGAERTEVIGEGRAGAAFHYGNPGEGGFGNTQDKDGGTASSSWDVLAPASPEAQTWEGWGTALKPSVEPAVLARKPMVGTVATNVLMFGTGALNVDGCRVGEEQVTINTWDDGAKPFGGGAGHRYTGRTVQGRWPANLIFQHLDGCVQNGSKKVKASAPASGPTLTGASTSAARGKFNGVGSTAHHGDEDGTETVAAWTCAEGCPVAALDAQSGVTKAVPRKPTGKPIYSTEGTAMVWNSNSVIDTTERGFTDTGGASRFFYCAKANKQERGEGNNHPTVKPVALMEYLIKLVLPPGGIVLDPFAGSGTTLVAAKNLGVRAIGMELDPEYAAIAIRRIRNTG